MASSAFDFAQLRTKESESAAFSDEPAARALALETIFEYERHGVVGRAPQ